MKAERDPKTGRWLIQYRYTDWQGKRRKSTKRGFSTKREAEDWLRKFLATSQMDLSMKFTDFLDLYYKDMENRLRECILRSLADSDAFQSGRCAAHNGRPETLAIIN